MKTITDIDGVYASGIHCGIKKSKKDLAYIFIPNAYSSAGVFTQNQFAAPSIHYNKKIIKRNLLKAVIINSGNANAGTGEQGFTNVKKAAKLTAQKLNLNPNEVAVSSTGIIGEQLPIEKIESGIEKLLANPKKKEGTIAAEAILTTDLFKKEAFYEKDGIIVAGFTKGSGMLAPNMATMLCYLVTNAKVPTKKLQKMLTETVNISFNMTTVDNDTSTNDMTLAFSTGEKEADLKLVQDLMTKACIDLTKQMAVDGEGAQHLIEINVQNAASYKDARKIALNIANSPLVKTAIAGEDPNWGRIIAAAAKDPKIKINLKKLDLSIQDTLIYSKEKIVLKNREDLGKKLKSKEIKINLDLNLGKSQATAWGCDLTHDYININTKYS